MLCLLSIACAAGIFKGSPKVPEPTVAMTTVEAGHEGSEIDGVVLDVRTEGPAVGALIVLQCACLEGTRETQTDAEGRFALTELPPGKYTLQVLFQRSDLSQRISLGEGQRARLRFPVGGHQEFSTVVT